MVKQTVDHVGEIVFATGKPDGTLRKLLDVGYLTGFGCQPAVGRGSRDLSWYEKHAPDGQRSVRSTPRWPHT